LRVFRTNFNRMGKSAADGKPYNVLHITYLLATILRVGRVVIHLYLLLLYKIYYYRIYRYLLPTYSRFIIIIIIFFRSHQLAVLKYYIITRYYTQ